MMLWLMSLYHAKVGEGAYRGSQPLKPLNDSNLKTKHYWDQSELVD